MSNLPYTRSQIVAAGKLLGGRVQLSDEAREAFRIAHAWRSAHVEPMHRLRQQLEVVREICTEGISGLPI